VSVKLLNYETQQIEDVPDELVSQAIGSGRFAPQKSERIPVVSPDGEAGTIAAEEAQQAFSSGYDFEGAEQRRIRERGDKYGGAGSAVAAGGLGLARGATFGLSDLALTKAGADPSVLKDLREEQPAASMAGEFGSLLLPGLGVGGAAGKILRGAGAGVSAVSKLGGVAEKGVRAVGGLLGTGRAARIVESMAPIARGVVEGAAFGAGQEISDAALDDHELTAERLMAGAKLGALFGGGITAGSMLAKAGVSAATPALVKEAAEHVSGFASDVVSKAVRTAENFFDPQRSRQLFSGAMQKELRADTGKAFQHAVEDLGEKGLYQPGEVAFDAAANKWKQTAKGGLPNQEQALARLEGTQQEINGHVRTLLQKADEAMGGKLGIGKGQFWNVRTPLDAKKIYQFRRDLAKELSDIPSDSIRSMKSEISKLANNGTVTQPQADSLKAIVDEVRGLVQNKEGSLTGLQDLKIGISDRITNKSKTAFANADVSPEIDVLKDLRRAIKERIEYGTEKLKADARFVGEAKSLAAVKDLNRTWQSLADVRDPLTRGIARANANVNVGGLRFRDIGIGAIGGGMFDSGVAGLAIAGANKLVQTDRGLLLRAEVGERLAARQKQAIRQMANAVQTKVSDAVRASVGAGKTVARIAAVKEGERALSIPVDRDLPQLPRSKTRHGNFEARAREVTILATSPARVAATIAREQGQWHDADEKVSDAMTAARMRSLTFLYEKLPKNPSSGALVEDDWRPSDLEISKWESYLETTRNPMSALEDLSRGTISPEQVETLKVVYPKIYDTIVRELTENVTELQTKLPYDRRIQLSTFFDIPVDASMQPAFIGEIQGMQTSEEQAEQDQSSSRSSKPLSAKFGDNLQTSMQRLELR